MCQVNVFQAKTELSKLLALLESKTEDEIIIARNGKPVARLIPWQGNKLQNRIGIAKGCFTVPDSIDDDNEVVARLFTAL